MFKLCDDKRKKKPWGKLLSSCENALKKKGAFQKAKLRAETVTVFCSEENESNGNDFELREVIQFEIQIQFKCHKREKNCGRKKNEKVSRIFFHEAFKYEKLLSTKSFQTRRTLK